MMQHRTVTGTAIASGKRERFEDRMRRIATVNLKEASMDVIERNPDSARWYCLHVMKGHEFAVENDLRQAKVDAFLPREKWVSVRKGRKVEGERAYLSGYVLVRCVASAKAFQGLLNQRHVIAIVGGMDGHYHIVHDGDVAVFKSIFEDGGVSRMPTDKSFSDGNTAEITHGPFRGFECLVTKVGWAREAWAAVAIEVQGKVFSISRIPLAFLKKL